MARFRKRLRFFLRDYYIAPLNTTFHRFRNGIIYFGVGLMTIVMANTYMLPSLSRELVTLAGLLFLVAGFFIALLAHMRILISRIIQFFRK